MSDAKDRLTESAKPITGWMIVGIDGKPRFTVRGGGLPELFTSRDQARSQNIDWRNGSRVVRVEIRPIKPKKRK